MSGYADNAVAQAEQASDAAYDAVLHRRAAEREDAHLSTRDALEWDKETKQLAEQHADDVYERVLRAKSNV